MEALSRRKGEHAMLGIKIGFWDYVTFAALAVIVFAFVLLMILILGLPGEIAIARKHPEADAVKLMGWVGFLAIVPWIQALIWSFKPTGVLTVDGREVAKQTIPHPVPALEAVDEWMDVGYDTRTGVDDCDYQPPFRFTGTINKVTFKPGPPELTAEQMKRAAEMRAKGKD